LNKVKITGSTLHQETLEEVPASVSVYTREELRVMGIDDLTVLMNFVSGYQSQRVDISSVSHAFSNRGYSSSDTGLDILILLDGQRLNSDWTGGLYLHSGLISLDKVERIEFIRGPGSTIYGSNAYLGVVNIISKARSEVSVAVSDGRADKFTAQWSQDLKHGSIDLFVNSQHDGGNEIPVYDQLLGTSVTSRDPYQLEELYLKSTIKDLAVNIYHSETKTEQFYTSGYVSGNANYLNSTNSNLNILYSKGLSKFATLSGSMSVTKRNLEIGAVVNAVPSETVVDSVVEEVEPRVELTLNLDYSDNQGVVGIEWRRPKITRSHAIFSGPINLTLPQSPLTHRSIKAIFLQNQGDIRENLQYIVGLRADDYSDFGSHVSPRAGLMWQYSNAHNFKALYGESFRAPSRSQTDIQNNPVIIANPNLEPEIAKTSELIWMYKKKRALVSTTLYHIDMNDVITDTSTQPIQRFNTGSESLTGIEVEWRHQWSDRFLSRVNATSAFDGPEKVNSEADFVIGSSLIYSSPKWSAALMYSYHSEKEDENIDPESFRSVPSRGIFSANLTRSFLGSTEVYLHIDNLLNKKYKSVATSGSGNVEGVENRGLSLLAGVRYRF